MKLLLAFTLASVFALSEAALWYETSQWGVCYPQGDTCIRRRRKQCSDSSCDVAGTLAEKSVQSLIDLKLPEYLTSRVRWFIVCIKIQNSFIEETEKCPEDWTVNIDSCTCHKDDQDQPAGFFNMYANACYPPPYLENLLTVKASMCIDLVDYCSSEDVNVKEFMYWKCPKTCKCFQGLELASTNLYINDGKKNYKCKVSFKFKMGELEQKLIYKKVDASCSESGAIDSCQNGNGEDYSGSASQTISGFPCQKWSIQSKESYRYVGDNNYCRNPDGEDGGVWCFSTKPGEDWDYCDVPVCDKDSTKKDGEISMNITGKHQFHFVTKNGTNMECSLRAALGQGKLCSAVLEDTLQCNVQNGGSEA